MIIKMALSCWTDSSAPHNVDGTFDLAWVAVNAARILTPVLEPNRGHGVIIHAVPTVA
jgi:hypothetical protein